MRKENYRGICFSETRVEITKPQTILATRMQIQSVFKRLVWTAGGIGKGVVNLWQGQHQWRSSCSANKVNLVVGLGPGLYEYGSKLLTSHHSSFTTTKDDRLNPHILHQSELWSTGVICYCKSAVKVVTPAGGIIIITKDKRVGLIACKDDIWWLAGKLLQCSCTQVDRVDAD